METAQKQILDTEVKILNHLRQSEKLDEGRVLIWIEYYGEKMRQVVESNPELDPAELIEKIEN